MINFNTSLSCLALLVSLSIAQLLAAWPVISFSCSPRVAASASSPRRSASTTTLLSMAAAGSSAESSSSGTQSSSSSGGRSTCERSTLTLLEHVNLNVPSHHQQDREHILEFYLDLLGCGLDSRIAINLMENGSFAIEEGLIWPDCGPCQFHLPRADQAQSIPGHIGLRYQSLRGLKQRLLSKAGRSGNGSKCFSSYEIHSDARTGQEYIAVEDRYGNIFHCREGPEKLTEFRPQPIVRASQTQEFGEIARQYGIQKEELSECRGIDYVEFDCPVGTAGTIAQFYDAVFDATTTVLEHQDQSVALVALGLVDENGRAEQYLIFRETASRIPEYDGHHVALYVGHTKKDFEQAFRNAELAGVVWVNPRFADKVVKLSQAKSLNQFRFKDVVDIESGNPVFQLEHEIRSVEHPSWPGWRNEEDETK